MGTYNCFHFYRKEKDTFIILDYWWIKKEIKFKKSMLFLIVSSSYICILHFLFILYATGMFKIKCPTFIWLHRHLTNISWMQLRFCRLKLIDFYTGFTQVFIKLKIISGLYLNSKNLVWKQVPWTYRYLQAEISNRWDYMSQSC